ncbi:hypothetical protein EXS71_04485 [Candidatus Uhrbacteria bacterium]|nr:hypothetical protein [Candidatus Uhrbacteria bacterium]
MDLKHTLKTLGLSKNETEVYLTLLEQGVVQAGPLIAKTKLHRMLVYNALDHLTQEGLVSVIHKKNIRLFQTTDPVALLEKAHRIYELAQNVLPELRRLQQKQEQLVTVRTLIGPEGFRTNLEEIIESAGHFKKKEICIIGGARDTDFYDAAGEWYPTYIALLEKSSIHKRLLAPASYSSEFKKKFAAEKYTELQTLSSGLSSPTYTRMTPEMVSIELYHPHIVIIQIRSQVIAQAYLDSFELLWKATKH